MDVEVDDPQRKALVEPISDTTALTNTNGTEIQRTVEPLPYVDADADA